MILSTCTVGANLAVNDRMTVVFARPTEPNNPLLIDSAWPSRALNGGASNIQKRRGVTDGAIKRRAKDASDGD